MRIETVGIASQPQGTQISIIFYPKTKTHTFMMSIEHKRISSLFNCKIVGLGKNQFLLT